MKSRRHTSPVTIGSVIIGGGHPIAIQSMSNIPTTDISHNIILHRKLYENGCHISRVAISSNEDIVALKKIRQTLQQDKCHSPKVNGDERGSKPMSDESPCNFLDFSLSLNRRF